MGKGRKLYLPKNNFILHKVIYIVTLCISIFMVLSTISNGDEFYLTSAWIVAATSIIQALNWITKLYRTQQLFTKENTFQVMLAKQNKINELNRQIQILKEQRSTRFPEQE